MQQPEPQTPSFTVGEADNAIVLGAGIAEGGVGVQTRANISSESQHPTHKTFAASTKLTLRVDGTWTGKADGDAPHGTISSETVSQTATATIGDAITVNSEGTATHNKVSFDTGYQLYWDDYGTADPANIETSPGTASSGYGGREKGLTIFGAAVDDATAGAPVIDGTSGKTWTALNWSVGNATDGVVDQTGGWTGKDLVTSNNVQAEKDDVTYATDGTYKFNDRASGKLLEFTHAMTKITVNLTANNGFTIPDGGSQATFKENVSVTLLGFNYMGKVDIEGKTSTATKTDGTEPTGSEKAAIANINMHLNDNTGVGYNTAIFDALVFPGNKFTATIADDANKTLSSSDPLLELNADGNIYKVTAAQLVKAIAKPAVDYTGSIEGTLAQGVNYVINIIVNKTEIKVTATVKDWETVNSEEVSPVINVNTSYNSADGVAPSGFTRFSFYRSASDPASQKTNKLSGYSAGASLKENGFYKPEGTPIGSLNSSNKWDFGTGNTLYWPNHNTHYHFRGVWPTTSTGTDDTETVPHVKAVSNDDATQIIDIKNVAYSSGSYPSDLLIGIPEFTNDNKTCANEDHTHVDQSEYGICATEGLITLNFKYIMSQVEVILSTSDEGSIDFVNIGANTTVEIVNVFNNGYVKLGDRSVVGTGEKGNYTLDLVTGGGNELKRHSAIVPQTLTFSTAGAETNVRFKITVTNDDAVMYANATEYNAAKDTSLDDSAFANLSEAERTKTPATKDIYFADIKPIKVTKVGESTPKDITAWESGVHYKYNLKLTKTEIKVTATITDWVTVNASQDVWF